MNADPIKYEVDKETGAIFVDRFMSTAMHYPSNYGYVPQTLSDDGDPVDVLVITPLPLMPGVVVTCRPIGILKMEDEAGGDGKVLAVPIDKILPIYSQLAEAGRPEPDAPEPDPHFFEHYKDLEAGKWVKMLGWEGPDAARQEIRRRHRELQAAKRRSAQCLHARDGVQSLRSVLERAALVQFVQVARDARALALEEVVHRVARRLRVRQPVRRPVVAPAAGRAPSCARPARRLRSARSRARCTSAAAGSSRPRSAGSRRARARPSSGRRRVPARAGRCAISDAAIGLPSRSATNSSQFSRHRRAPCGRRSRASGRASSGARGRCGCSSGRRSPSRPRVIVAPRERLKVTPASRTLRRSCWIFLRLSRCRLARKSSKSAYGAARGWSSGTAPCCAASSRRRAAALVGVVEEQQVRDDSLRLARQRAASRCSSTARAAASRASRRGPGTGVNGTAPSSLG